MVRLHWSSLYNIRLKTICYKGVAMGKAMNFRYFVGDFETTVYEEQDYTEVWAAACVELYTEDVKIFHSISEIFQYLREIDDNVCIYFHNLKFDGAFWMSFLLTQMGFKQAFYNMPTDVDKIEKPGEIEPIPRKDMPNDSFNYSISNMGQWYRITIKTNHKIIEIRDSLKLIPFSVKMIGESFGTQHKKLDMKYEGFRYAGCEITPEEQTYIKNDVLVVKEALEIMFNDGHNKLTIGSCCLSEFKKLTGNYEYKRRYPDLFAIELNTEKYGAENVGEYIRKSYRGGWCYLVPEKAGIKYTQGLTADVNSLYPSMMSSESGNRYPIGTPEFWSGNFIPKQAQFEHTYYFIRIKTRFYIKDGMLPTIQVKGNMLSPPREMLTTSDVFNGETGQYYPYYIDTSGNVVDARVELTLTQTDFELIKEHYELLDFEILDGCWFWTEPGIFDEYIEKYKKIKLESKGARKQEAKLFLNNLYGKMASSTNSSFKLAYVRDDGSIGYFTIVQYNKQAGYIPVGSAITSYARNFTIRAAQKNYYGSDNRGFIYADTDSIHCDLKPEEVKGIKIHDKNFCCWKLESYWDEAFFVRPKTYIEHVTHEDGEPIEPFYNVTCAGMPKKCKDLFLRSMEGREYDVEIDGEMREEEREFISVHRLLEDFNIGLEVPSKLLPKTIKGGVVLKNTTYKMR